MLQNKNFEYAICGGFAIDLFLGYNSRKHGDIDILAYWKDRDEIILYMKSIGFDVYEMLGGGKVHRITDIGKQYKSKRNIFCCKADCELVQLSETQEDDIYFINFQHIGQSKLNFIEFLFNDKSDKHFLYARNHNVKRNLKDVILFNKNIPYLAPEICLLYKSTDTEREGYQQDYELAIRAMSSEQIEWLNNAISFMNPDGHKWLNDSIINKTK
ncbi:MAG: hypothetical protein A2Y17_01970 [Clostridiales bacterium GWF2_38_85]|nr:MAG: hypothetical protein A2Y17_01970 [Clostridiales bacterium GWF2_38_85]HBL85335.1 hypothetical protein [Clostridiales bacterium]